jgi:hypothetical protein
MVPARTPHRVIALMNVDGVVRRSGRARSPSSARTGARHDPEVADRHAAAVPGVADHRTAWQRTADPDRPARAGTGRRRALSCSRASRRPTRDGIVGRAAMNTDQRAPSRRGTTRDQRERGCKAVPFS